MGRVFFEMNEGILVANQRTKSNARMVYADIFIDRVYLIFHI